MAKKGITMNPDNYYDDIVYTSDGEPIDIEPYFAYCPGSEYNQSYLNAEDAYWDAAWSSFVYDGEFVDDYYDQY